jgi:hypothetical protein
MSPLCGSSGGDGWYLRCHQQCNDSPASSDRGAGQFFHDQIWGGVVILCPRVFITKPPVSQQPEPILSPKRWRKNVTFLGAPDERFHFSVAKAGDHWGFATFHIIPFIESWCFNRIGPAGSLQRTELLSAVASALLALVSMGPCCQVHWSIRVSRVSRFWAPGPDPNFSRKPIWIIIKGIP